MVGLRGRSVPRVNAKIRERFSYPVGADSTSPNPGRTLYTNGHVLLGVPTVPAMPAEVTREQLFAYLDESLDDAEIARIEKLLRTSKALQGQLSKVREERDRGEHSLG